MSRLLSRWQQPDAQGRTQSVTPESAGWEYVGFKAYEMKKGSSLRCPPSAKNVVWYWSPDARPSPRRVQPLRILASG